MIAWVDESVVPNWVSSCCGLRPWGLPPVRLQFFERPSRWQWCEHGKPSRHDSDRAHTCNQRFVHIVNRDPVVVGCQFQHASDSFFSSKREHRRKRHVLFSHLSGSSVAIRAEKILAMLVESGFAYCCIWVRHRSLSFFPRLFRN